MATKGLFPLRVRGAKLPDLGWSGAVRSDDWGTEATNWLVRVLPGAGREVVGWARRFFASAGKLIQAVIRARGLRQILAALWPPFFCLTFFCGGAHGQASEVTNKPIAQRSLEHFLNFEEAFSNVLTQRRECRLTHHDLTAFCNPVTLPKLHVAH